MPEIAEISGNDNLVMRAPAKINLCLHVLGKRPDGYHNIFSAMQLISIYDEIILERRNSGISLSVEGAELSSGPDNLVYRAAQLIMSRLPVSTGVHIRLRKNIPIGAGLGGGSSDAAATLAGLNKLFQVGLSREELMKTGCGLGADIPFFLLGEPAIAEGIGEIMTPMPGWKYNLLIVYPGIHISTAWAYNNLNFRLTSKRNYNRIHPFCYQKKDMGLLCRGLRNDFEPLVMQKYSVIRKIKDDLIKSGALGSMMSGTGSCVFGLFARKSDYIQCRKKFVDLAGSEFWIAGAETV